MLSHESSNEPMAKERFTGIRTNNQFASAKRLNDRTRLVDKRAPLWTKPLNGSVRPDADTPS